MSVTVKFFAALADRVGCSSVEVEFEEGMTVAEIWKRVGQSELAPDNIMMAVNMQYAKADQLVSDGDEIGFFPPVTGGL